MRSPFSIAHDIFAPVYYWAIALNFLWKALIAVIAVLVYRDHVDAIVAPLRDLADKTYLTRIAFNFVITDTTHLAAAIVSLAVLIYVISLRRKIARYGRAAQRAAALAERFAYAFTQMKSDEARGLQAVVAINKDPIDNVVDAMAEYFSVITRSECHVSVKVFLNDKKGVRSDLLKTFARSGDAHSGITKSRWLLDQQTGDKGKLNYFKNTAFKSIIDEDDRRYYLQNNLYFQHMVRLYENQNKKWKELYRATLVVPITLANNSDEINKSTVAGFLCIDNKKGRFDRAIALQNAMNFAKIACAIIIHFGHSRLDDTGG
ncbi:MAG: hypothetical protein KGZ69_09525 [Methylomonas sp.]|nr:hypothetical protein [Methylomonas sp.]